MKAQELQRGMTDKEIQAKRLRNPHMRLVAQYGKAPCCIWNSDHTQGGHGFEWANVSGEYTDKLEDYLPMCIPCHRSFDTTPYQREQSRLRNLAKLPGNIVAISQYNGDELIATFATMSEASKATGVLISSLSNHLAGKTKLCGGYTWRRA